MSGTISLVIEGWKLAEERYESVPERKRIIAKWCETIRRDFATDIRPDQHYESNNEADTVRATGDSERTEERRAERPTRVQGATGGGEIATDDIASEAVHRPTTGVSADTKRSNRAAHAAPAALCAVRRPVPNSSSSTSNKRDRPGTTKPVAPIQQPYEFIKEHSWTTR